jgi:hypothetical protein
MAHRPASPVHEESKPQGLTQQQRTMIGVVGLALCLLVGGGILYLMLGSGPKQRKITVDPNQQTADPTYRPQARPVRRAAIIMEDSDTWVARGTSGAMYVRKDGGVFKLEPFHPNRDFLTNDQVSLVSGFVRATRDEAMAKEWGISADQITRLKAVDLRTSKMSVSDKELGELRQLWDDYQKAGDGTGKAEAEKKVIARLDELGKANLEASRKAYAQRLNQIKSILTPDQIAKITG